MHAAATKNMAGFDGVKFELRHSTKLVDVVPENYFDLIVSSHAIEHAPNPCKTLGTQALQLVRKGGYAFHEIPHQDESALRSGKQRGSLHLTFWSKMSVRSIARVTGWRVISAANYDTYDKASEHGQWVRAMLQRPAR